MPEQLGRPSVRWAWAVVLLGAFLAIAGCAAPSEDRVPEISDTQPVASTLSTLEVASTPPLPQGVGLSLTACQGSESALSLPSTWVQDHLPAGFKTLSESTSSIGIDFYVCGKVSLDGVDLGAASVASVITPIQAPDGTPAGGPDASVYLLDFVTDHAALRHRISAGLLEAGEGVVSHQAVSAPDPAWWADVESSLLVGDNVRYSVKALPEKALDSREDAYRLFFGANAASDFWDVRSLTMHSVGDGAGIVETSDDSILARMAQGATRWESLSAVENAEYRMFLPPSPSG